MVIRWKLKIKSILTHHVGPFLNQHFSFDKDWTGKPGTCQAVVLDGMNFVQSREGQFIITSHSVDVWERYEQSGMRIELGSKTTYHNGTVYKTRGKL